MKFLKYIAISLVVAATIAVAVHFYRESIVRTVANRVLRDHDIAVTELSIGSLKTDYVYLSYLELEQVDGSRYLISGLSFPLDFPHVNTAEISIERLRAIPAQSTSDTASLVPALRAFLGLPGSVSNTGVSLASLEMPGLPETRNIVWQSDSGQQHLTLQVAAIGVRVVSDTNGDGVYPVTIIAGPPDAPDSVSLDLSIRPSDSGYSIHGSSAVSLSPWLPILKGFALLPVDIMSVSGDLAGSLQLDIGQDASASVQLSLTDELLAEYAIDNDRLVRVRATTSAAVRIGAEYPSSRWNADLDQLNLEVSTEGVDAVSLGLSNIRCMPDVSCTADLQSNTGPMRVGSATIDQVHLSASLKITKSEQTSVVVSPGPLLDIGGIESASYSVATARVALAAPATFSFGSGDWQGDADELHINFDTVNIADGLAASFPLVLSRIGVRNSGSTINMEFTVAPPKGSLSLGNLRARPPMVKGSISLQSAKLTARGSLSDQPGAITGTITLSHALDNGRGELQLENFQVDLAKAALSSFFVKWPYEWDVVSGLWASNAALAWQEVGTGPALTHTWSGSAQSLAGNYGDIAFAGLTTELKVAVDASGAATIAPANLQVSLVDVGVPVREISADYSLDIPQEAIAVQNVSMSLLGGTLLADAFHAGLNDETIDIVLRPDAIQLQFIVELAEFRDIDLSGSISGVLPVTIEGKTITITDGRLKNDPPGGVIRYLPGLDAGDSTLDLVSRALANFRFDSLTSTVNYTRDGDLKQQMRIEGMNPDMDDRQPVILNLNVENNIPSMLRSLQATRSIEEILEKRSRQ